MKRNFRPIIIGECGVTAEFGKYITEHPSSSSEASALIASITNNYSGSRKSSTPPGSWHAPGKPFSALSALRKASPLSGLCSIFYMQCSSQQHRDYYVTQYLPSAPSPPDAPYSPPRHPHRDHAAGRIWPSDLG